MNFFNKVAAILCILACASLCMGMEKLSEEHRSNLIMLASHFPAKNQSIKGCLENAHQFVEFARVKNGFLTSPVSLDNLKSLPVSDQLITFTKLLASLHSLTQCDQYFLGARQMATRFYLGNFETNAQGLSFLIQNYYEVNDFKHAYNCILFIESTYLSAPQMLEIENILAKIFSTKPEGIEQIHHLIYTDTKKEDETINICFLNALCQLKSVPKLVDITCDRIGGSYSKLSYLIADREMKKKYITQAILYFVLGAKFGNTTSLATLIALLDDVPNRTYYYTCLFVLLRANDPEAQDLFNKVCEVSGEAFSWFKKYKEKQEIHKKYPAELEMVKRVMDSYYLYKSEKEYQTALDQEESNPVEALNHLLEAQRFLSRKAAKKLDEIRGSEQYKNPNSIEKDTYGILLKKYDMKLAEKNYQEYMEKKVQLCKSSQRPRYSIDHCLFLLHIAAKFGNQEALKELERIKKSSGYNAGINGVELDNPETLNFDDYLGYFRGRYDSSVTLIDMPKMVDNREHCSEEHVIQGADHKANVTNKNYNVSTETISTTTASSTTSSIPLEQKGSISAPLLQETEVPLSTMSGEGANVPPIDHQEDRAHPKVKTLKSTGLENEDPNLQEEVTKPKAQKNLKRSSSTRTLSRRNSLAHIPTESGLDAEDTLKGEPKRKELRRTVTLTSIPTSSAKDQGRKESHDEKTKHHKKTLSTKFSLSSLNPWKNKDPNKSVKTLNEKDLIEPQKKSKSKGSSSSSIDQLTSKSESESKKAPRKFSKKASSSSLSSSRESVVKTNNSMDTLIDLRMLPEHAADYHPRHIKRLHQILTHKYKLDDDDQNTLWVILGERTLSFEVDRKMIKRLSSQFDETDGSHSHGSHEVINGMGITLNPNIDIDRKKKGSYHAQIEQVKDKLITRIAPKLTLADYEAAQNNKNNNNY